MLLLLGKMWGLCAHKVDLAALGRAWSEYVTDKFVRTLWVQCGSGFNICGLRALRILDCLSCLW